MANITNNPNRLLIGATGGIGVGKSTALKEFVRLGVQVIDVDDISRQVTQPKLPAYEEIAKHFPDFINPQGLIVRKALAKHIFDDRNKKDRKRLEAIQRPYIAEELKSQLANPDGHYTIMESALLFETGSDKKVDRVLVIDANEDIQRRRAVSRGLDVDTVDEIMSLQLSRRQRLERANDVIKNNGNEQQLLIAVNAIHFAHYLPLALAKNPQVGE